MPAPNLTPPPRRGASLLVPVALGVLLLSGVVAVAMAFRAALDEPTYAFSCDSLSDPTEVRKVLRFADECERLRRWTPDTASDAAVAAVSEHLSGDRRAARWSDLYRAGDTPGLATLNGTLAVLADRVPDAELPRLRELPPDQLRDRLRAELNVAVQRQRDEAIHERLHDPSLEPLIVRLGDKPYPQEPGGWRRWACSAWGRPVRDNERWVAGLLDAVTAARPQLMQVAELYERVSRLDEVAVSGPGRPGLVLRRMNYTDSTLHAVRWDRDRTTADWAVWHRAAGEGDAPTWIERDTGIRLHNVPFTDGDEPRPAWPPPVAFAAEGEFTALLRALGFPAGLTVRPGEVRGEGVENPTLVVSFAVRSPDFPDWRWEGRLRLDAHLGKLVAEQGRLALGSLWEYLPRAGKYRRLPIRLEEQDSDTLTGRLEVGSAPPVRMRCRLEDGRLTWLGPDNLRDQANLAAWLTARHQELAPVAHRLVINRIGPSDEPAALEGTLAVPDGSAAVGWRLARDGTATFQIPENWPAVRRSIAGPAAMAPDRAESLRRALEGQLQKDYPTLARHAEVVASASGLCFVGVRIDDWPLLRLGPVEVDDPAEAKTALLRLLAEDSVRRCAAAQWESVQHPRYGSVRSEIAGWSPDDAHATIHCVAPLWPDSGERFEVAWREKTWLNLDGWQRDSVDVPKQIEKVRDTLLEKVNQYLGKSLGPADYVLTVEPDTTDGALAWLSLKPFSIKLRARLRIKPFDVVVVMGGTRLDYRGLHMPDDYHVTIERTLTTPYCALSDPTVRVNLKKQSLVLGCKVTPPLLPIVAAGGKGKPTADQMCRAYGLPKALPLLRLDNPWLHLIYLRGEFGGQLRDTRLHAQADLRMLEFIDAAHGDVAIVPRESRVEARLRAGTPVTSRFGLPVSLDGETLFTPTVSRMQGKVRLLGLAAGDATFRVVSKEPPARLRLDTGAEMPMLGLVHLSGETDMTLTTHRLRGEGRLTAAWLQGEELRYVVEIRDGRMVVDFRREKAGKRAVVRVEAPGPGALDEGAVRERLLRLLEVEPVREASPAEVQVVARLADTELEPLPPSPQEDAPDTVALRVVESPAVTGGALRPVANVECVDPGGPSWQFRYFDTHNQAKDVGLALKARAPFKDPRRCVFRSWLDPKQDDRFTATLVFDTQQRRVSLLTWDRQLMDQVTDVTERFKGLGELFPTGRDAGERAEMVQDFIATHTDLTLRGNRILGDVRRVGGGFLLEYEPKGLPDRLNAVFTWRAGGGVYTARLFEPAVSRSKRGEELYARLEQLQPRRRNLLVVAVEGGPQGRIATLEPVGARTWNLRPEAKDATLTLKEPDGSAPPTAELAHRVAIAVWRHGLPTEKTEGVCVTGGALVWSAKGFWLFPSSALLEREPSAAPFFLTWEAFRRWDADSVRLLPAEWRAAKTRAAATPELIAQTFLRDWNTLREAEPGWGANPLGLLIGLAERKREVALDR